MSVLKRNDVIHIMWRF